ncbi:protein kinase domain-containing protein [Flexivirga oryzae]|uniref:non-specific serine/threonine protein kinase n=1 Tax=Flexivirga oryzae TaxID=1794944 RepID=A0A839NDL2_9MICO|nr:protein kinase [Flexivirga oryzae]MBB2893265.1 stress response protein SCP2/predicted Ser/Thr protein kinase [Flexivirga oryzae]
MQRTNGTEVGGRYRLESRIAGGGMGEVWRGVDTVLERPVAIKLLKTGLTDDPEFLARFRTEARNAARLSHGNIAQVYDYGEDSGTAYLVMELLEGEPLSKVIAERAPMDEDDAVHLLVQAANALHAAHAKGIVHRDVKPANIVVDDEFVAKLTDFGIARALDASSMTRAGEVMGTPQYLAPEAAMGKEATPESDIYSLGVVAFQMLVGHLPFHADTAVGFALAHVQQPVPPLPESVSAPLRAVIDASLAKDPDRRPQGAVEFARELQEAIGVSAPTPHRMAPVRVAHLPEVQPTTPVSATVVGEAQRQAAFTLSRGQNAPLSSTSLSLRVEATGDVTVDLIACELGADERALGDDSLVFFNNRASADGVVRLTDSGRVEFDASGLDPEVHAVVVGMAVDPPATLGQLTDLRTTLYAGSGDTREEFHLPAGLTDERAAVLARIYRRGETWKVRNVSAGWQSGLPALVDALGLAVASPAE